MKINWGEGCIEFKLNNKDIKLQVQDETTRVKLFCGKVNVEKEKKRGGEIILAQIFSMKSEKCAPSFERTIEGV
jgi:hypothetical protein